jgi:hypothetical protein
MNRLTHSEGPMLESRRETFSLDGAWKTSDHHAQQRHEMSVRPGDGAPSARRRLRPGMFGAEPKARGMEVWGTEIEAEVAREASTRLDRVVPLDGSAFAEPRWRTSTASFNDVLEHLVDPTRRCRRPRRCRPGGVVVCSIPNVCHPTL